MGRWGRGGGGGRNALGGLSPGETFQYEEDLWKRSAKRESDEEVEGRSASLGGRPGGDSDVIG